MAYIQKKSIVASIVKRFEVEVVEESKRPEPLLSLTLEKKGFDCSSFEQRKQSMTKLRRDRLLNSKLAVLRCCSSARRRC